MFDQHCKYYVLYYTYAKYWYRCVPVYIRTYWIPRQICETDRVISNTWLTTMRLNSLYELPRWTCNPEVCSDELYIALHASRGRSSILSWQLTFPTLPIYPIYFTFFSQNISTSLPHHSHTIFNTTPTPLRQYSNTISYIHIHAISHVTPMPLVCKQCLSFSRKRNKVANDKFTRCKENAPTARPTKCDFPINWKF